MTGGGKYEEEARVLSEQLAATGIILIVLGGKRGNGFEVRIPPEDASALARVLREVADEMEEDIKRLTSGNPS